tara:strand:+ start:9669 stop:10349 length:681 start_codon:yes stop_codon:yes gene_type:complete
MTEIYSTFDLLQWLDDEARAAFKAACRPRKYRAGQVIYMQGDSGTEMFRLCKGTVSFVVNHVDGKEMMFTTFQPGDCFGDSSLIDGEGRPQTAEALTDLEVEVLDGSEFNRLRERFRCFDNALLRSVMRQFRLICTYYEDASMNPLAVRVATRIVSAAESFAPRNGDGSGLAVPLSQSVLASLAGASRQSVNKVLNSFQAEKLIKIEYGHLVILDLEGVRDYAARL